MRVRCPHCHNAIEVVPDAQLELLTCPSCGSHLDFLNETLTHRTEEARTVGHFVLHELVGLGHFGEVWMARDTQLDRIVAVKIPRTKELTPASVELFRREASAAAQLRHPHIVTVHEVGRDGDTLYIVSDFIRGVTLANYVTEHRYAPRDAAALCATVAEALHHAHEAGVVHRDLKPGNIMLDGENRPHLMDFGLAKREAGEATITAAGKILGTPAYMSPEQARGEGHHADRKSDVYSLGVILYELLTGERPFKGDTRLLLHQVQFEEPRPPRKRDQRVPRDLETICLKALAKQPERRYAIAQEMAADLHRYLRGEPIAAKRVSRVERVWRWGRRNPFKATTALAMTVLVSLLAAASWKNHLLYVKMAPVLRRVQVTTDPPGATVVFVPRDADSGEPIPERLVRATEVTPSQIDLPPANYLVVAVLPNGNFHEVFRAVPEPGARPDGYHDHNTWVERSDEVVELPLVEIKPTPPASEMAFFEGSSSFTMGQEGVHIIPPHRRYVPAFYLDTAEVIFAEYRNILGRLPPPLKALDLQDDEAIHTVSFDEALAHAEKIGKRLPDETEYEYAATWKGTRPSPSGRALNMIKDWPLGKTGFPRYDRLPTSPPVFGLYSNVAEWTTSWPTLYPKYAQVKLPEFYRASRIVRGGPLSVITGKPDPAEFGQGPRWREARLALSREPGLGFRCARSAKPRTRPEDFVRVLDDK